MRVQVCSNTNTFLSGECSELVLYDRLKGGGGLSGLAAHSKGFFWLPGEAAEGANFERIRDEQYTHGTGTRERISCI